MILVLASRGRIDEALEQYRKALELQPSYAEAHNNLGLLLARRGQLDEAIAQFQKALEANPTSREIRNNLGAALASHKRNPGADRSESR